MQTQNYSTPATSPIYARTSPNGSGYVVPQTSLHKKGSLRNGDILKRSRIQPKSVYSFISVINL